MVQAKIGDLPESDAPPGSILQPPEGWTPTLELAKVDSWIMMTYEGMVEMAVVLQERGLSEDRPLHYASLIGDTPELDEDGKLVIRESSGTVVDRIEPID